MVRYVPSDWSERVQPLLGLRRVTLGCRLTPPMDTANVAKIDILNVA